MPSISQLRIIQFLLELNYTQTTEKLYRITGLRIIQGY